MDGIVTIPNTDILWVPSLSVGKRLESMATTGLAHEKDIGYSLFQIFQKGMPLALAANELIAVLLTIMYFRPVDWPRILLWLGSTTIGSCLLFILIRSDSMEKPVFNRKLLYRYELLVGFNAGNFGLAFLYLFQHASIYQQYLFVVAFIAFVFSGIFILIMVPTLAAVWTSILSAAFIIAARKLPVSTSLVYFLITMFGVLVAGIYRRLYKERFLYQMYTEDRERELSMLFEQSPLSIVLTDKEGTIMRVNKRMENLSGFDRSELNGKNTSLLKSGKTPRHTYDELWGTISQGGNWTGELINKNKKGQEYIEKASISPIKDADGTITNYIAIKENITLQREYEEQLQRQNEIIQLFLRDFEDQSGDWLWELDEDLRICYISEKMLKYFQNPTTITGLLAFDFLKDRLPEDDYQAETQFIEIANALYAVKPFKDLEIKLNIEGALTWLSFSAVPFISSIGRKPGWRGVGRDITDKKLLENQLYHKANYDELTGLPNRSRFKETIDNELGAAPDDYRAILGIMRLEKLDLLRTNLGSIICNQVIAEFISEFRRNLGDGFVLGRLGKDEFVFWKAMPDVHQIDKMHRFVRMIQNPLQVGPDFFHIDLPVGIAFYPDDALDRGELFRAADLALNEARASSARKIMRYSENLATGFIRKLTLINEFPAALAEGQFRMCYQPQVDALSGTMTGAEALIRWYHPQNGTISPGEFIPWAEQSGFITSIGEWTLEQACTDAMDWEKPLLVSINVSGIQLRDSRRLSHAVKSALKASGLPPRRLVLEITESAMFGSEEEIGTSLSDLRSLGIVIALDDFGTGYSSLAYIQRLHLDKLKIDQSFIRKLGKDKDAEKIVTVILDFARSMNLETVAEGVEREDQALFLRNAGCHYLQGYLYGKAMPQESFRQIIRKGH